MRVSQLTIHMLQLILLATSEGTCPASFIEESPGICLHHSKDKFDYCQAHQYCYKLGEDVRGRGFITGKYYQNRSSSNFPNSWTGLHRLSTDVGVESNSWSVADPHSIGEYIEEEDLITVRGVLVGEERSILYMHNKRIHPTLTIDSGSMQIFKVLCQVSEFGEAQIDPPAMEQFRRDPSGVTHLSSDRIYGCSEAGTAETKMACGMRCKLNRACRSFAYHPNTNKCVLQLYVDSKLKSNMEPQDDGTWERYVRVDW